MKTIKIAHMHEYPLIECPKCKMKFVLIAVIPSEENEERALVLEQAKSRYCPYCGAEMEGKDDAQVS